ncbi:MAG: hypothetical protein AABY10_05820 [Nanoarchaeota archaeon]
MNVIGKIFANKIDEQVHEDFVKFGRGIYQDRYLLEGKKQKTAWSVKTSSEFANYLVIKGLAKVKGEIHVTGIIVSTIELKDEDIKFEKIKKYMGIKQMVINTDVKPEKLISLMIKYPRAFYALSFKMEGFELKIKEKPPKSAKPGTKKEILPKADFCSLKTNDKILIDDLFFDIPEFEEVKIRHVLQIEDIEIPKGITEPEKLRAMAKRKGKVKRIRVIDEKEEINEKEFVA